MNKKKDTKKVVTTYDKFLQSLSEEKRKKFEKGYREYLLSELLMALMSNDAVSVRELAKEAGLSPSVIQGIRSGEKQNITVQSFFKILRAMDCSLVVQKDKNVFPMDFYSYT